MALPPPEPEFIPLVSGQCYRVIADDIWYEKRKIRDPITKRVKTLTVLVLHVIKLNDRTVDKKLSITSYKAQQTVYELYKKGVLLGRPIEICVYGEGFLREYQITLL